MKKILVILVALVGFGVSVHAGVIFRSTQSLCKDSEQIILKSSGTCEIWTNSTLQYSGSYAIEGNVIIMSVEGGKFRATATMNDSKTKIFSLNFNNTVYRPCNN
jgi:hypothetical protein